MEENPLKSIFKLNKNNGIEIIESKLISSQNIQNFFIYISKNINKEQSLFSILQKTKVLQKFYNIIKENRTIIEFFSSYNDKSIYLYLFELFLHKNTNNDLKSAIILLLNELRINIQLNKKMFEFIFQNLSSIYSSIKLNNNSDLFFGDNLILLNSILGETENILKPRNYFACNGSGKIVFELDNDDKKIKFENCFVFILSFYINLNKDDNEDNYLCNLISMKLDKINIKFELNSKGDLILNQKVIKNLPKKEWRYIYIPIKKKI